MNWPNFFTVLRILLMPAFVVVFYLPMPLAHFISALIFLLAAFTDWIDGYLARKLGQITPFGAFFDPVADKLIVAMALLLLVGKHANVYLTIPALVIVCREIMVS